MELLRTFANPRLSEVGSVVVAVGLILMTVLWVVAGLIYAF
jgi:hypothetical protein